MFAGFKLLSFRYAKTYPHLPHWYTVRNRDDPAMEAAYVTLYQTIREHGVREFAPVTASGRRYRKIYWYAGDGYKYWTMTTKMSESTIVNRALVVDYDEENRLIRPVTPPQE